MCDLHQFTVDAPTPLGSIPDQIRQALAGSDQNGWVKLYNSGNFFDPRSIPPDDYREIAELCTPFERIIVENHPRFGGRRMQRFQKFLRQPLEVAVGLESVQPRWLARMQKKMTRDDFDQYASELHRQSADLRVFLIVGVPGVTVAEAIRWARLSVRHAVRCGARHISLIPARRGNGWGNSIDPLPQLSLDDWQEMQRAAIQDADGAASVTIDLWDFESENPQMERLREVNLSQQPDPKTHAVEH
ncbi:MAG: Fe-S oxidoreductase [Planctomycetota bacterium]